MLSDKDQLQDIPHHKRYHALTYGSRYTAEPIPKLVLPEKGMPSKIAYRIIKDELNLDGNPSLNLASFVTTWMDHHADRLLAETLGKNYIDQDEYPQTTKIQNYCINMLARLFNAPEHAQSTGTSTIGSSEAIHLAGLAMKWNWRKKRKKQRKKIDSPNIVMGQNVQVVWEKFARYFEVEPRYVPLTHDRYILGVPEALKLIDANTIGVVGILGSTYTGEYEPIEQLNEAINQLNNQTNWDVPIHVDAASGGFVAPFTQPQLRWDFRLNCVKSINTSGHKYGLVYPGIGWVVWRDKQDLPEDLIFHVNYLGGDQPTFHLNFSKSASHILGQYYNFLFLGRDGYRAIMLNLQHITEHLTTAIEGLGIFKILSKLGDLPVITFSIKNPEKHSFSVYDISQKLRERGWIVPAYTLAPNASDITVLRIVVKESMSLDMAENLINDLNSAIQALTSSKPQPPEQTDNKHQGVC
ncbi:Glutamate decarboxylase [Poriferisphaera corsica]|uniref:Glutamate decarboxylase n=1 Tax=Poriferisphaera corsica TaxID=2528020 RepID=A0A517YT37_9BACT|nr:glutamate decarboxylase [Poriferisphaera corsica]QDU33378.1 Glutamate decarboxylase [Poriferisphaera corsica]